MGVVQGLGTGAEVVRGGRGGQVDLVHFGNFSMGTILITAHQVLDIMPERKIFSNF